MISNSKIDGATNNGPPERQKRPTGRRFRRLEGQIENDKHPDPIGRDEAFRNLVRKSKKKGTAQ